MSKSTLRTTVLLAFACAAPILAQAPTVTSVGNAASFASPLGLCPGTWAAVLGSNFGTTSGALSVQVGGKPAFVERLVGSTLFVQLPVDLAVGPATLTVTRSGQGSSVPFAITVDAFAPAILTTEATPFPAGAGPGQFLALDGRMISAEGPAQPGETIFLSAIGLGPTIPVVATGVITPVTAPATVSQPSVTVAGQAVEVSQSVLTPGAIGQYLVRFTLPAGLAVGTHPVILSLGGKTSNTVTLPVGAILPPPTVSAVANTADPRAGLAPAVLALVAGANFGQGSVTVQVGGSSAYVSNVTPTLLTIQIPSELQPGSTTLVVTRQGLSSVAFPVRLDAYAPAIFAMGGIGVFAGSDNQSITPQRPALPGDRISLIALGLGPTDPPVGTGLEGPPSPFAATTTLPQVTIGTERADVSLSVLLPGQIGAYQVTFTVPAGAAAGNQPVRLDIGGKSSNTVNLPVGQRSAASPAITRILNGASFGSDGVAAPGSFLSIFGTNFGSRDRLNGFPATELEGVSVTFNGTPAPLLALIASAGQINLLAPNELPQSGNVIVQVRTPAGTSQSFTLRMSNAAPGIFPAPDPSAPSRRNASAVFAGTRWLVILQSQARAYGIADSCSGLDPLADCGQPAAPGSLIQIYTTGLGRATPGGDPDGVILRTGSVAPADGNPTYSTVERPAVTIGGVTAEVQFSGLAPGFAGLYQINVRVPEDAPDGDEVPLRITMPNGASDTATIPIRR